jgi:CubicO group peptidase (beta-lactamase class C family)
VDPRRASLVALLTASVGLLAAGPSPAAAATSCREPGPGETWQRVTPQEAGMDAAALQDAIDYGTGNASLAIRVYRNGCRVGADRLAPVNEVLPFESWSLAKSVTSLIFGRAMTLGLISPEDPLGSLVPEADLAHGRITLRDLLTATSGLHWNGFRDYNIFMPNRLQEALTVPIAHQPGTYWEYSQSGPALVAEATARAVGTDFQAFAQAELFGKLGIGPGSWSWARDGTGHTQGFFGLRMRPDDYARLGELMRRDGVWRGERLLSPRYVRLALRPSPQNGCHGFLIWLNASKPCVGPRILDRPVGDGYRSPGLPHDAFQYAGLMGQLVTVFPTQGVVVVRVGTDLALAGGSAWEDEMHRRILSSITEDPGTLPQPRPDANSVSRADVDHGFPESLGRPQEILEGELPPPLPPAGPDRARALQLLAAERRGSELRVRAFCPPAWYTAPGRCAGRARTSQGGRARYRIPTEATETLRFELRPRALRRLDRHGRLAVRVTARNRDHHRGTTTTRSFTVGHPRS